MDLKKQMEMDLEELQKKLLVLVELSGHDNYIKYWKLIGKIDLIEKYLKAFKNDMVIEVGKKYKVKENRTMEWQGLQAGEYSLIYEEYICSINGIATVNDIKNNKVVFTDGQGNREEYSWVLDIETFKHIFEEVKDEN